MTKTPAELWLLELERERLDTSWRAPKPRKSYEPTQPIIVKQQVTKPAVDPKAQKNRDRTFFHAGRFAMGARDDDAIRGNLEAAKLTNQKGNKNV